MAYLIRNIENASQLKFCPGIIFSTELEQYINDIADIYSVHPDSLAIILINCVAATLEFSFVLRANSLNNKIPTNLYNIIVARSSYGKSELTKLLRDMLKTVASHRPNKFRSVHQIAIDQPINPTLDEMSKAGLMSALDDCCRTIVCDEADLTFGDSGLFLSHNMGRTSAEMNCRGLVMTLFDRSSHAYIRQLANRSVSVTRSKLNILGCSTGDIISNMIIRMKGGFCFDPAIGRFLFWPLDGPVIPDKIVQKQIDYNKMASLDQFAIILSFVENATFSFEEDALNEIVSWGNVCKQKSFDERNKNECLSARLGKSIQHAYRLITFIQTIEIGGIVNVAFIDEVETLFHSNFSQQFAPQNPEPFRITKDVALRAIDLISCNMRQFVLLFDSTNAPKLSSIGRQIVVIAPDQQQSSANSQSSIKLQQRYNLNSNNVAAAVILFPSVCFTMKQLHKSTVIHNYSGGGILKEVLQELVTSEVLFLSSRGIKHSSRSTSVYIKRLPLQNDTDVEDDFLSLLSEYTFNNKPITMEMYRRSCDLISLDAVGTVQEDVYDFLRRPEYGDRDLSVLNLIPKTKGTKSIDSAISLCENDTNSIGMDIDIDQNLLFGLEQETDDNIMLDSIQQLTDHQKNIDVVPVDSASPIENVVNDIIEKDRLNQKELEQKQSSVELSSNTNQSNELLSDISFEHRDDTFNDGFVSPTAWQTRARTKDFTNKSLSSTPLAKRTRAQLKRKRKEDSDESKKIGTLKRIHKK